MGCLPQTLPDLSARDVGYGSLHALGYEHIPSGLVLLMEVNVSCSKLGLLFHTNLVIMLKQTISGLQLLHLIEQLCNAEIKKMLECS